MNRDLPPIHYGRIDCMGAIERAIEHTKFMLFRPFDLSKWISMGVIIFLAILGSGGGGVGFPNFGGTGPGGGGQAPPVDEMIADARAFVSENLSEILIFGSIAVLIITAITAVIVWLGSRGRLMFVRSVALNDAGIGVNWTEAGKLSASLFWFSFLLMVASWVFMLMVGGLAVFLILQAADAGAETLIEFWPYVVWPLLLFLIYLAVIIPVVLLLNDFVVPVMYHFNVPIGPAWRVVLGMISGNVLTLTLFYVIRFVIGIVKGMAIFLAGCLTCFIGFLPVVSQALTAPVHVFDRAFSMFALESLGPDFHMIRPMAVEADPFEGATGNLRG